MNVYFNSMFKTETYHLYLIETPESEGTRNAQDELYYEDNQNVIPYCHTHMSSTTCPMNLICHSIQIKIQINDEPREISREFRMMKELKLE